MNDRPAPAPTTTRPARWWARATLLGLLAAISLALVPLTGTPAAQAADAPAPGDGWIRAGHLAAGNGAADVRLTPFAGGDAVTVPDVAYGDVTAYRSVEPGLYTVAIRAAGADMDTNPMVSTSVRVEEGGATSVFAIGEKGAVSSQVVRDDLTAPAEGQARVRLLSAAPEDQAVSAEVVDGPLLAEDLAPGETTGYAEVDAQTWTVEVTATDGESATGRVPVEAGGVYTLLAVADEDGSGLRLEAVEDASGSATMPRGGVDTGAGGLADGGPSSSVTEYAVAGSALVAAGLLASAASVGDRRRREAGVAS